MKIRQKINGKLVHVSAMTGEGINDLFEDLLDLMIKTGASKAAPQGGKLTPKPNAGLSKLNQSNDCKC